jgi:Zn-dependent metalloprotease
MKKNCFVIDEPVVEQKEVLPTQDITPEKYNAVKQRVTYREVEHKEAHELGAVMNNLDSKSYLDMNTEMVDEAVPDFAIVKGMVTGKIYSPWIGKLLEDIEALSVSIGRKGRTEKKDMTIGARKSKGLKSWNDAIKPKEDDSE